MAVTRESNTNNVHFCERTKRTNTDRIKHWIGTTEILSRWDQSPGTPRKPHLNPLVGTPAASHGESFGESLGKSLGESLGESLCKSLGESHARMDMNWTQWRRTCCRNTHQMRPSQRIAAHHRASQRITGHHSASQGIPTHHNESHDIITHHNKSVKGDLRGVHLAACGRMFPLLSRGN